ncbi:MAG: DNA repair protein RecO [Prevotella sp.]|nr:DNA repair protein RecO [Prevotella sp.]
MLVKTKAIVLHTLKIGETSMVVDMFAKESGRISFVVRIPKTTKARVRKQFFQPLTLLDLEFDYRPHIGLQHIRDVRLAMPFTSIPFEPIKLSLTLFLAEFLYYVTRDEQQNQSLFQYVENSITWLDSAMHSYANFHLVFMMRLSRFVGFWPNLDDFHVGCYFDLRNASFTSSVPLHPDFLQSVEAEHILTLMRMNYESMHLFHLSRAERNRITELAILYYRLHIPQMPELQSFSVLKELFS